MANNICAVVAALFFMLLFYFGFSDLILSIIDTGYISTETIAFGIFFIVADAYGSLIMQVFLPEQYTAVPLHEEAFDILSGIVFYLGQANLLFTVIYSNTIPMKTSILAIILFSIHSILACFEIDIAEVLFEAGHVVVDKVISFVKKAVPVFLTAGAYIIGSPYFLIFTIIYIPLWIIDKFKESLNNNHHENDEESGSEAPDNYEPVAVQTNHTDYPIDYTTTFDLSHPMRNESEHVILRAQTDRWHFASGLLPRAIVIEGREGLTYTYARWPVAPPAPSIFEQEPGEQQEYDAPFPELIH
ncbi:hypothetical protein B7463_g9935, partial [Scytalidium lignicola]